MKKKLLAHDGAGGTQNQEALELDAETELFRTTRVQSREVRDSDEGKVRRKGGDFAGAGGGGGSSPARRL